MSGSHAEVCMPDRSEQQRKEALALANEVRSSRCQLKEQLKRKEISLASLLTDYPGYLETAKVSDLLRAMPGYGPRRVDKLLYLCRISHSKTVAGLTPRQRENLCEVLQEWDQ